MPDLTGIRLMDSKSCSGFHVGRPGFLRALRSFATKIYTCLPLPFSFTAAKAFIKELVSKTLWAAGMGPGTWKLKPVMLRRTS